MNLNMCLYCGVLNFNYLQTLWGINDAELMMHGWVGGCIKGLDGWMDGGWVGGWVGEWMDANECQ